MGSNPIALTNKFNHLAQNLAIVLWRMDGAQLRSEYPRDIALSSSQVGAVADYREISQEYAKEGIKAATLINAGAAIALLSQGAALIKEGLAGEIRTAMLCWAAGVVFGVLTWILAFSSTRFVDKSEREHDRVRLTIISNRFMLAGQIAILVALICFIAGCTSLAIGLGNHIPLSP